MIKEKFSTCYYLLILFLCFASVKNAFSQVNETENKETGQNYWMVGIAKKPVSPSTDVWLAGYGTKRQIKEKLHDIWVKVLALQTADGKRAVLITSDNQGMSRTIYEELFEKINSRFNLDRSEFMLTFSHNHSGPRLRGDLVDYYPSDDLQDKIVAEYSDWQQEQIIEAVEEALNNLRPVKISRGTGHCSFAVNRRENKEVEIPEILAAGGMLKGVVDHSVPVLSIMDSEDKLLGILFGYACHPTTLSGNQLLGDYPGFAQINLEAAYPGATAMFVNTCGADMNPLPRHMVELCENYGKLLSDAVEEVITGPMIPVLHERLNTAFKFVRLDYEEVVTKEMLLPLTTCNKAIQARWAGRMLDMLDKGIVFPDSYNFYPLITWQLGDNLLLIGTGGETVVDYSLRFKKEFGEDSTWVIGYANILVSYIPSRRIWEEGGYEGGPHLDEYGHPALKWAGNIEDCIAEGVHELVRQVKK